MTTTPLNRLQLSSGGFQGKPLLALLGRAPNLLVLEVGFQLAPKDNHVRVCSILEPMIEKPFGYVCEGTRFGVGPNKKTQRKPTIGVPYFETHFFFLLLEHIYFLVTPTFGGYVWNVPISRRGLLC